MYKKLIVSILFTLLNFTNANSENVKFMQLGSMPKNDQEKKPPNFIKGKIYYPKIKKDEYPVVLFLHGTGGLGYRSKKMKEVFLKNNIAFFEIDMFGSRNKKSGHKNRLKSTRNYLPDVWGALDWISQNPKLNKNKIAIVGQSMGGFLALNIAIGMHTWMFSYDWNSKTPKAIVAWYPVCSAINTNSSLFKRLMNDSEIKNIPIENTIILSPELDAYEKDSGECGRTYEDFFSKDKRNVWIAKSATHAFDSNPKKKQSKNNDPAQFSLGRLKSKSSSIQVHDEKLADMYREKTVKYILNIFNN